MARTRCRGQATDLWFPSQGGDIETPKSLCGVCAVRTECLAYALEDPGLRGIWGATSDRERMRLRRATG